MSARVAVTLALFSLAFGSPLHASAKERDKQTKKLAWAGIHRGPLAPARARALEALLLDELDGYESFRLVDAGGGALDDRILASDAARVEKLIDDGVDLLLNFKDKKAITKFDQAIEVFESRLTTLRDHEKLHEALLAKAEAHFQSGNRTAATETLKHLAALSPKRVPNKKTHPAKFVALWDRALEELGAPGRVIIDAEDPACTIFFDGKPLGNAPAEVTQVLPGKHYVVARWPFYVRAEAVQVAPGREARVRLDRGGPAENARTALLETIEKKQGPTDAITRARRVVDLASADEVLVASVREENGIQQLLISKHGSEGEVEAIILVLLQEGIDSEVMSAAVRQLGAVLFVEKRVGELEITANGEARGSQGLTGAMFGRSTGAAGSVGSATIVARDPEPRERPIERPPDPPPEREEALPAVVQKDPPIDAIEVETTIAEPDRPITKEWWFWVGVGAAVVGAVVIGGSVLLRPDPTSTEVELVVNLGGG